MKKFILILSLLLLIAGFSYLVDARKSPHELIGELMYFPSGIALRAGSMGYYAPLADVVWLRFIQYYGEHRLTDTRFQLMYHILDILTTLDPGFLYAYTLGGLMLTHDAQRPDQAHALLKKGMYENPEEWRIPFMYAFMNYVFLQEYHVARTYFGIAAQKPGAPDMVKRWHAFVTYSKLGDLKTGLALWIDFYEDTRNPEEKSIARYYIEKIRMRLDIEYLTEKVEEFKIRHGRQPYALSELITGATIDSIPSEPHGGRYYLDEGSVRSTWEINMKTRQDEY
jgi:hypothetical protein